MSLVDGSGETVRDGKWANMLETVMNIFWARILTIFKDFEQVVDLED